MKDISMNDWFKYLDHEGYYKVRSLVLPQMYAIAKKEDITIEPSGLVYLKNAYLLDNEKGRYTHEIILHMSTTCVLGGLEKKI